MHPKCGGKPDERKPGDDDDGPGEGSSEELRPDQDERANSGGIRRNPQAQAKMLTEPELTV
jgi:hypothetical protein